MKSEHISVTAEVQRYALFEAKDKSLRVAYGNGDEVSVLPCLL